MLKVCNLHSKYANIEILKGISLEIAVGEIVTILGSNGSGKTTLLRAISGLTKPTLGTIEFNGKQIQGLSPRKIVRAGISHVPQGGRVFPYLTVHENLRMGAYMHRSRTRIGRALERVYSVFPMLKDNRRRMGGVLSRGQQQILAIGRGLMAMPDLLLLDEPTSGLASTTITNVARVVSDVNQLGIAILLVEQNVRFALELAKRIYVMQLGKITMHKRIDASRNRELIEKAYLSW